MKKIKISVLAAITWIITGTFTFFFMYHKTDLNVFAWILLVLAPVFVGWLIACINQQANLNKNGWCNLIRSIAIICFISAFVILSFTPIILFIICFLIRPLIQSLTFLIAGLEMAPWIWAMLIPLIYEIGWFRGFIRSTPLDTLLNTNSPNINIVTYIRRLGIIFLTFLVGGLNIPTWVWIMLIPLIYEIAWLNGSINKNSNAYFWLRKANKAFYVRRFKLFLIVYSLTFLIGIGLIWLFGWTYGFALASMILILFYGSWGLALWAPVAISILPFLYKLLLG